MTQLPITFSENPTPSTIKLPAGACDTHCHVLGPVAQFPYDEKSAYRPGDAPKEKLFALHDAAGFERCVIVQSGCHGYDNSVVADAMSARAGRYLGVALVPPEVSVAEISRLHEQGFRAIRYNYLPHLIHLPPGANMQELQSLAKRIEPFGWHFQIHMVPSLIADMSAVLRGLPVPVVVDHMGLMDASAGLEQAPFKALQKLADADNVWMKVSGLERASVQGAPYSDAVPFARTLVENHPDRVIWGTDWPHPNLGDTPPDDGVIIDRLAEIAPGAGHLQALLVDNPTRLFGFEV